MVRHVINTCFVAVNFALPLKSFLLSTRSLNISRTVLLAAVMLVVCTPSSLAQVVQRGRDALLRGDYERVIEDEFSSQQQLAGAALTAAGEQRLVAPFSTPATSGEVYPTGIFPDDVIHVQDAVRHGGNIILKATDSRGTPLAFNFGPPVAGSGAVALIKDVKIRGENINGMMTQINGGDTPFRCVNPIISSIQDIDFEGPRGNAIRVLRSAGVEITGNRIRNVVEAPSGGITIARGILVAGLSSPADISGRVLIAHNSIDGIGGLASYGISVAFLDAVVSIVDNSVSRINLNGILVGNNTHLATIMRNTVVPGPLVGPPDFTAGNGIFVGHSRGGGYVITNNEVSCENPFADGIAVIGSSAQPVNNSVITSNDVTVQGSFFGAISLYDVVSSTLISANNISGDGALALQIGVFVSPTPGVAVSNTLVANHISTFHSRTADVLLDIVSQRTTLVGFGGTVIDYGFDNRIIGFTKL